MKKSDNGFTGADFSYSLEAGFTTVVQIPTIVEGGIVGFERIVGFGFRVITVSEDEQILFPAERKSYSAVF